VKRNFIAKRCVQVKPSMNYDRDLLPAMCRHKR